MKSYKKVIKLIIFTASAILSGISLFIIFTTANINNTVLEASYHSQLFSKHDIYKKAHSVISSSMNQYIDSLKKASPEDFVQHKQVFDLLRKSVTPDLVKFNVDSIREGLFQYFRGERKFLPDIYLSTSKSDLKESTGNIEKTGTVTSPNSPYQALTKIEKINLSAILLYINRSDIYDTFFKIKFLYYAFDQIPGFFILVLFLLAFIGIYTCSKFTSATRWIAAFTLTGGVLSIFSGIGLFFYTYSLMPKNIYPLVMSLPLQKDVVISYLDDCIKPIAVSASVFGVFLIFLSAAFFYLPAIIPLLFSSKKTNNKEKFVFSNSYRILKNTLFAFFCLLLLSVIFYKLNVIASDFEANGFGMAITKMKNANTVTQIISAKDEAVYTLHVKLVDSKTNAPITNTKIFVDGKSTITDKYLSKSILTDEAGTAKFTLDKGAFRISFDSDNFPTQYQIPAALFCELKSAGTTIITVNLEEPKTEVQPWGIVELEVLDKENKPVAELELTIDGIVSAPGFPNTLFSVTNSEGIAVFKINPGKYKIAFVPEKFPGQYTIPVPVDVLVSADSVTRYTFRIVDAPKTKEKN
ncbi:MAG: hypothetical protein N3I35_07565 [Clostridia bacterium]|nr:hypothetical protein [Clostridia bacterium]